MNIPKSELLKAEKKCNMLAQMAENFQHIVDDLEHKYGVDVRVQIIRPVIGGGAGQERVILTEIQKASG